MYKILSVSDRVRVPPSRFGMKLENAVKSSLEDMWEGTISKEFGVVLSVVGVEGTGEGKILPGDGAIHYPVDFKLLVYYPELHEVVRGNIIDVTEFGVFVRIGPLDGMIHVSQLMNDFVTYDGKNSMFIGRDTKNTMKESDVLKGRIISISMGKQYKIGLTTRQPGLGVLGWTEKKVQKPARKAKPGRRK